MVRSLVAVAAVVIGATSTLPTEGHAFANLPLGATLKNRQLPTLDGKRASLLGTARANVFVFFRPNQDRSVKTLSELADLEKELAGRQVRFVAVTSDSYDPNDVRAAVKEAGIRMPVLIDKGDALYGAIGVRLHPVVGIADARGKLAAYQHFRQINMKDIVRGRIQVLLGDIGQKEMMAILEPPAAVAGGSPSQARSRARLAEMLLSRGDAAGAIENARAALALDPASARAHAVLGRALAASGDCEGAAKERKEALRLDPREGERGQLVACADHR